MPSVARGHGSQVREVQLGFRPYVHQTETIVRNRHDETASRKPTVRTPSSADRLRDSTVVRHAAYLAKTR